MKLFILGLTAMFCFSSCKIKIQEGNPYLADTISATIETVATSERLWTGVTVSQEGRMFVCFPRWSNDVPISVGEIVNGSVRSYPDTAWNDWKSGSEDYQKFICVQSVYVDDQDFLWILDPASPNLQGVVKSGARLHKFDLKTNMCVKTYAVPPVIAPAQSYLNDVRIDTGTQTAYITDSGLGAIVVVDLNSGVFMRRLSKHQSTKSELDSLTIDGVQIGAKIHADGIALSPDKKTVYYQALSGKRLFSIPAEALRDPSLDDTELAKLVTVVADVGANDGILSDSYGNIFLTGLESNAINVLNTNKEFKAVVQDKRIQWPDTLAIDTNGTIYFTVTRLHLPPESNDSYMLYKIVRSKVKITTK